MIPVYYTSMMEKIINHITVGYLATNCWIYPLGSPEEKLCAVIDPGDEVDRIITFLDKLNLFPEYILLTHGHFDHTTAAPLLAAEYSKRCDTRSAPKIAIHKEDSSSKGNLGFLESNFPIDLYLNEGDNIGSLSVLHLPGHSPGSIGLLDKEAGVLFSGDTLFCGDYGRTDLPGGSETLMFASLKRLFALDAHIKVYPGHGPATMIGVEAKQQGLSLG